MSIEQTPKERFCFSIVPSYGCHAESLVISALAECKTLRTVEMCPTWYGFTDQSELKLQKLLANSSIRTVVLRSLKPIALPNQTPLVISLASEVDRLMFAGPGHSQPVQLRNRDDSDTTLATAANPFYVPMQAASRETRLRIWTEIFACAVQKEASKPDPWSTRYSRTLWYQRSLFDMQTTNSLLVVSRDFYVCAPRLPSCSPSSHGRLLTT